MAQLDAASDWRPEGQGFDPHQSRQHSFVEIDHEIFSTVIPFPTLKEFYGRHHDLVNPYNVAVSRIVSVASDGP